MAKRVCDRLIELADGKVANDTSKKEPAPEAAPPPAAPPTGAEPA
jgi:hypothetical protein